MVANQENLYLLKMNELLTIMHGRVLDRVVREPNDHNKILLTILNKARRNIPLVFSSLDSSQQQRLVHPCLINCDLLNLEPNPQNQAKKQSSPESIIQEFFKAHHLPKKSSQIARLDKTKPYPNIESSSQAMLLLQNTLYRLTYQDGEPGEISKVTATGTEPMLKLITAIRNLPKNALYQMSLDQRQSLGSSLGLSDSNFSAIDLDLLNHILAAFAIIVRKNRDDWQKTTKDLLLLALRITIYSGLAYWLTTLTIGVNLMVIQCLVLLPLSIVLIGLGIAAYTYYQTTFYQRLYAEFNEIEIPIATEPPSAKPSVCSFFKEQFASLTPAFSSPSP